jgi:hypothetical protein
VREETTHADPVAAVGDKRPGGRERLDIGALALPELRAARDAAVDALVALSGDERHAARVLKLSRRQRPDIAHNATLRTAPTLPAVDRYTGVLFDALDAATLDAASRRWLGAHVLIHSAPFGPVGALDAIPTYRLAAGTARSASRPCDDTGRVRSPRLYVPPRLVHPGSALRGLRRPRPRSRGGGFGLPAGGDDR